MAYLCFASLGGETRDGTQLVFPRDPAVRIPLAGHGRVLAMAMEPIRAGRGTTVSRAAVAVARRAVSRGWGMSCGLRLPYKTTCGRTPYFEGAHKAHGAAVTPGARRPAHHSGSACWSIPGMAFANSFTRENPAILVTVHRRDGVMRPGSSQISLVGAFHIGSRQRGQVLQDDAQTVLENGSGIVHV